MRIDPRWMGAAVTGWMRALVMTVTPDANFGPGDVNVWAALAWPAAAKLLLPPLALRPPTGALPPLPLPPFPSDTLPPDPLALAKSLVVVLRPPSAAISASF